MVPLVVNRKIFSLVNYRILTGGLADFRRFVGTGHYSMLVMAPEFLRSGRLVLLIEVASIELLITWPNIEYMVFNGLGR